MIIKVISKAPRYIVSNGKYQLNPKWKGTKLCELRNELKLKIKEIDNKYKKKSE